MANWYDGLEPKKVLEYFEQLSRIPRGSGNMEAVSDAVTAWLRGMGLRAGRDAFGNVKAFKPASPGMEDVAPVLLTAHLDMVCAKVEGSDHDFTRDPITVLLDSDGDTIRADGTTLGADDGMAAAMILAIFADDSLVHPPLEALFTADEETDMSGALNFDYSDFRASLIICLDGDPIGVAGAGELDVRSRLPFRREAVAEGSVCRTVSVSGLQGGHSGKDSTLERANAAMLLNRCLMELSREGQVQLVDLRSGVGSSTAYAVSAKAVVAVPEGDCGRIAEQLAALEATLRQELKLRDEGVCLSFEDAEQRDTAVDGETFEKLMTFLTALPDGVCSHDFANNGMMESSVNTGVIFPEGDSLVLLTTIRSTVKSRKYYLYDRITRLCRYFGAELSVDNDLPQWDRKVTDEVLSLCRRIYPDCELVIQEGTDECGIFSERMPAAQVITLQCPYHNAHSTNEWISAKLIGVYYKRLLAVLAGLKGVI